MSDTPETDKAERMAFSSEYMVPTEFARQLERERDEAISSRKESAADWLNQVEQANARVSRALQQVAIAESERDDALSQIVQAECRAERFCQERDEAREERDIALLEAEEISQELANARKHLAAANKGAEINSHINNSLTAKLAEAKRERDEARQAPAKWIPVAQALPDDDATLLVHMADDEVWAGYLDAGVWRYVSGVRIESPVLHWRPFPDPPRP